MRPTPSAQAASICGSRLGSIEPESSAMLRVCQSIRANPGASLADLIRLGRRPRTSTVASLKRLEEAGLVEHPSKGQYRVVDQATTPKPAWIGPVSGRHVARHAADGRVRDEMTIT